MALASACASSGVRCFCASFAVPWLDALGQSQLQCIVSMSLAGGCCSLHGSHWQSDALKPHLSPKGKCCRAMQSCGVVPEDVDYVNAHATSTMAGDMAEYRALRAAIPGDHVRMNATKSMIGHLLGGAGAVEAVATVQAIRTGMIAAIGCWPVPSIPCMG